MVTSERVKELLKKNDLRQTDLAIELDRSIGYVSDVLREKSEFRASELIHTAEFFGVTVNYLLGIEEKAEKSEKHVERNNVNMYYHRKEIEEIAESGNNIAVLKNGTVTCCNLGKCHMCAFKGEIQCEANKRMIQWMYAEHKDPVKLTILGREILKRYASLGYNWIARDSGEKGGLIKVYKEKPVKYNALRFWDTPANSDKHIIYAELDVFPFITYADPEPYNIQTDILANCEITA